MRKKEARRELSAAALDSIYGGWWNKPLVVVAIIIIGAISMEATVSSVELGQLIDDDANRDAIHVAVAPVRAYVELQPGQHIRLAVFGQRPRGAPGAQPTPSASWILS